MDVQTRLQLELGRLLWGNIVQSDSIAILNQKVADLEAKLAKIPQPDFSEPRPAKAKSNGAAAHA